MDTLANRICRFLVCNQDMSYSDNCYRQGGYTKSRSSHSIILSILVLISFLKTLWDKIARSGTMHCQNTNLGKEISLCYLPFIRAIPDINNSRTHLYHILMYSI